MSFRTIVIPASVAVNARNLCKGLAPGSGDGMFLTGLSATGGPPSTHFVSSGSISDEMAALLPCKTVTKDAEGNDVITTSPGMPAAVPALATKAGLSTTKAKITTLYAAIDVSDQDPFAALARLGLKMVQVPL